MRRPDYTPEALALLQRLPCRVRTCKYEYRVALALAREYTVTIENRRRLGNGQVTYDVRFATWPDIIGREAP